MRKIIHSNAIFDVHKETVFNGYIVIMNDVIEAVVNQKDWTDDFSGEFFEFGDNMIVPGFIDAHIHFYLSALLHSGKIKSVTGQSEVEVANQVSTIATVNGWKIGIGWFSSDFGQNIYPTHHSIDKVCNDTPVMLISGDAHSVWFNQCALDSLAITTQALPTNLSGEALQDQDGLTGCFTEAIAIHYLAKVLQPFKESAAKDYLTYMKRLNQMGITSIADVALSGESWDEFIYPEIYEAIQDEATVRVSFYPAMRQETTHLTQLALQYQDDWVQFGGVKQFFDGVTSTHTAYLKQEYATPYFKNDVGGPLLPIEKMRALILQANQMGWPIRIHTIGDQAIHSALCFYQESAQMYPLKSGVYNTLEHLEVMDPNDLPLTDQEHLVISVQPSHLLVGYETLDEEVGPDRASKMFPFHSLLRTNGRLAFGTDSPVVVDVTPIDTIYYASSRRGKNGLPEQPLMPHEKLTVGQAIVAHTLGAAKAISREDLGEISSGKKADLCVLSKNLLALQDNEWSDCSVLRTMISGNWVWM